MRCSFPFVVTNLFAENFAALRRGRTRYLLSFQISTMVILVIFCTQILQLFVQQHSSLLHVSKHAPDCIGFKGAFETQRFPSTSLRCIFSSHSTAHSACRLQPQLQGAAARMEREELDVEEHFDDSSTAVRVEFIFYVCTAFTELIPFAKSDIEDEFSDA